MAEKITKDINLKVKVDDSDLKKIDSKIDKAKKDLDLFLGKSGNALFDAYYNQVQKIKNSLANPNIKTERKNELKEELKFVEERYKLQTKIVELEKQREKILLDFENKKSSLELKRLRDLESSLPQKEQYQEQQKIKEKYKDQLTPYQAYKRYRGFSGLFNLWSDKSQDMIDSNLQQIDEDIYGLNESKKYKSDRIKVFQDKLSRATTPQAKGFYQHHIDRVQSEIEDIDKSIKGKEEEKLKVSSEGKFQLQLIKDFSEIAKNVQRLLLTPFTYLSKQIIAVAHEFEDLKTGVATYNTATSLITNARAREQQIQFGLTSGQNFALTRTMSMLGMSNIEDLMYMNSSQREKFNEYMNKYSKFYDESSGMFNSIQEMQLEVQELKEDLSMEFLSWIAENKDVILGCIQGIFEVIKFISNMIMNILSFFHVSTSSSNATGSDSYNNSQYKTTNITITANATNNATGVLSSQNALEQFNKEFYSNLAKQLVTEIGG